MDFRLLPYGNFIPISVGNDFMFSLGRTAVSTVQYNVCISGGKIEVENGLLMIKMLYDSQTCL